MICRIGFSFVCLAGQYADLIVLWISSFGLVTEMFEPWIEEDIFSPGPFNEVIRGVCIAMKL